MMLKIMFQRIQSVATVFIAICAAGLCGHLYAEGECQPEWVPTFGSLPGLGGAPWSFAVHNDGSGSGPALYAGGGFVTAGGVSAFRIARYNADLQTWAPVGGGFNAEVLALTVFDDGLGDGPALYAAGAFTSAGANRIAKWDGTTWLPLGTGMNNTINSLVAFDDGSGPALFAGGSFTTADGVSANRVAKWNGTTWSAVGPGINDNQVNCMAVYDDGSGTALYAGGTFTIAGGIAGVNRVAKWDGTSWEVVGFEANNGVNNAVKSMIVYDDGLRGGPSLFVAGGFTEAGGATGINRIAKWDGTSWTGLAGGLATSGNEVRTLAVFDDGDGPELYVGGQITTADGITVNNVARWNGTAWSVLDAGVNNVVNAMTVFDDGNGPRLYIGGFFNSASGVTALRIATWNDGSWSALGSGLDLSVITLSVLDDETGSALYAAGDFTTAGGVSAMRIAKWNGLSWSGLGTGFDSPPNDMVVFDDGGGPAVFVGGAFTIAGGVPANRIAKWDGTTWSAIGTGMNGEVRALAVFDDGLGGGPALYAAGIFTNAGGTAANRIAKWDGTTWSPLGTGHNMTVNDLIVFDDGSGSALYSTGRFTFAGGLSATRIAKWNGVSWSPLGTGLNDESWCLAVYDDGTGDGPSLYVGGAFQTAGGVTVHQVAKWNHAASNWSALGSGITPGGPVRSLAVFNDGTGGGPALFAAGNFTGAGGVAANRIAKWEGSTSTWSALGTGFALQVRALAAFDDGSDSGLALFAGGEFTTSPAGDSYLAKWRGCVASTPDCPADIAPPGGDTSVNVNDLLAVINGWGPCRGCAADINGDGQVNVSDLLLVINAWGPCPN